MFQKVDPYKSKERLEKWKAAEIKTISKTNYKLLRDYVLDMEKGVNVAKTHKGQRSAVKLLSLASRIKKIMELAESKFKVRDITKIKEQQLYDLFLDMQQGKIKKSSGEVYLNVEDYIKRMKSFWHWHIKRSKKASIEIVDITSDLTAERKHKPKFVYFTKEQLEKMLEVADYETRVFMMFLFDTGIRAPTEALNTRVSDFSSNFKELDIRDEVAKTFGRKIRLMLCSEIIKKYVEDNNLKENDLLFSFNPATMNKRLKIIGKKILGDSLTLGRSKGSDLTMYDFRHSSACFWLLKYKSRSALLYRFGWKREEEIHYYTELLGMKDTISEEDMLMGADKTQLEKEIIKLKKDNELFVKALKVLYNKKTTQKEREEDASNLNKLFNKT